MTFYRSDLKYIFFHGYVKLSFPVALEHLIKPGFDSSVCLWAPMEFVLIFFKLATFRDAKSAAD